MREIKLRAWDKKEKEMISEIRIFPEYNWLVLSDNDALAERERCDEGQIELMQFTGLKDKNEKEIYEGDILGDTYMLIVHWCEKCGGFQMRNEEYGCFACEGDLHWAEVIADKNREVIGNIYEHAELLQ